MKNFRFILYALTLFFFGLLLACLPVNISMAGLFEVSTLISLAYGLVFLSIYLALLTMVCVTEVNLIEPILLVLISFGMSAIVIGLQYSLAVLVLVFYCFEVRRTNKLFKVPNPSSSGSNSIPFIFAVLGLFVAAIVFTTFVPRFEPELFSPIDQFAEMLFGCSPETRMVTCARQKVLEQTDYDSLVQQCYQMSSMYQQECIDQINQKLEEAISRSLEQYAGMGDVNSTVGEFVRSLAANQVNQIAESMGPQFRLLFAFGAFSIISSLGGFVSLVVSVLSSAFTFISVKLGLITTEPRTEEVIYYLLE